MKTVKLEWLRFERDGAMTKIIYQNYVIATVRISDTTTIAETMELVAAAVTAALNKDGYIV